MFQEGFFHLVLHLVVALHEVVHASDVLLLFVSQQRTQVEGEKVQVVAHGEHVGAWVRFQKNPHESFIVLQKLFLAVA